MRGNFVFWRHCSLYWIWRELGSRENRAIISRLELHFARRPALTAALSDPSGSVGGDRPGALERAAVGLQCSGQLLVGLAHPPGEERVEAEVEGVPRVERGAQ